MTETTELPEAAPGISPRLSVPAYLHSTRPVTPTRSISLTPKPNRPDSAPLSRVFLGVAVSNGATDAPQSVVVVTDGTSVLRNESSSYAIGTHHEDILGEILDKIERYADARGHKVEMIALAPTLSSVSEHFIDRIWLALDALPFVASADSAAQQFSLDSQAVAAIEEGINCLEALQSSTVRIQFDQHRQVLVDADHRVELESLKLLERTSSPALFSTFRLLSDTLKHHRIRIGFFSATPRGGGVALMRHALIRLWQRDGVDARWFVPPGDSNVFNVTKRNFHNILQGVAPATALLTSEDKELFQSWSEWYFTTLWKDADRDGSEFLKSFDLIVIDDPQLTGLIPFIRKHSPRTKIVYRSHIQIRADLVNQGAEQQRVTWEFLWQYIKQVDLFVAHPLEEFVPQIVRDSLPVVFLPPCTSPLDGLNKPIPSRYFGFYRQAFDLASRTALGREVDWNRGYILQIARFDPSKGIPDLVEAYRLFRLAFSQDPQLSVHGPPQLVLTGHSAIDDPDGNSVLKALYEQLASPLFDSIRDDVFAVRAPSSDRLLNTILQGADVVAQVSTREGYEIKVSEAIHAGKWIIATRAGGIPLQVRDGIDGCLVDASDAQGISDALVEFYRSRGRSAAQEKKSDELIEALLSDNRSGLSDSRLTWRTLPQDLESERHFTLANATMWEYLFLELLLDANRIDQRGFEKFGRFGIDSERGKGIENLRGKQVWRLLAEIMPE